MKKVLFIFSCLILLLVMGCTSPTTPEPEKPQAIEVKTATFEELKAYNFEPDKKYCIHVNEEIMSHADGYTNGLNTLINTNKGITEVFFDESVTEIKKFSFYNCKNLTSITIKSATSIGNSAFAFCNKLTSISLPKCLNSIGNSAFSSSKITEINIPASVTEIGNDVFSNCSNLTTITVTDSNKDFSSENGVLFDKGKTKLIVYPEGKTGDSYTIPTTVTEIGNNAFQNSSLTSITIPENVKTIGEQAFNESKLTTITVEGAESIGSLAFGDCTNLTSVTLSKDLKSIENNVFCGCSKLTTITITDGNNNFSSEDGVLFDKGKTKLIVYPEGKTGNTYTIPNTVTEIGSFAFQKSSLTSITISANVNTISDWAFYESKVTTIIIEGAKSIGKFAFGYCSNIKEITISASVKNIGNSAFCICPNLATIKYPGTEEEWNQITGIADASITNGCNIICTDGTIKYQAPTN